MTVDMKLLVAVKRSAQKLKHDAVLLAMYLNWTECTSYNVGRSTVQASYNKVPWNDCRCMNMVVNT